MMEINEKNLNVTELNDDALEEVSGGKTHRCIEGDNGKSNVHASSGLDCRSIGVLQRGEDDRGTIWNKIIFDN